MVSNGSEEGHGIESRVLMRAGFRRGQDVCGGRIKVESRVLRRGFYRIIEMGWWRGFEWK